MEVKIFRLTSTALNADAYDQAEEKLNAWLGRFNGKILHISQSSHIRHDTDSVELVDLVVTVLYEEKENTKLRAV